MKKIYLIIAILSTLCWSSSCTDDHDPVYTKGIEETPHITTPENGKEYVLDKEHKYDKLDTFTWNAAQYAVPVGVRYTLEIELENGNFEKPVVLTSLTNTQVSFTVQEMNTAMEKLDLPADKKSKIKLRLASTAYGGEEGTTLLDQFPVLYSEIIELYITPYEEERAFPEHLYMIGDEFGNWKWDSQEIVEMIPVHGKEGEFWCINYFNEGKGFKWAPKRAWANDFNGLDTNTGFVIKGTNAEVETSGLYMVYINMKSSEICIEPAKVYGIGDCFHGWADPVASEPFTTSGEKVSGKTLKAGGLRMYAVSSISTTDWWTREFVIIDGKITYRGNGSELQRIDAEAGKTVTLDFRAGTGSIN